MTALLLDTLPRLLKSPTGTHWAKLVGQARHLKDSPPGLSAQLAPSFGLQPSALPWAALFAAEAGISTGSQRWLVLEPLSLKVAPNGIYVMASNEFGQSVSTMRELWTITAAGLATEGLQLQVISDHRAVLALADEWADPDTETAEDLLGAEISAFLPADRGWRRRLGELQIEWSQVTQPGPLPVNSPWFGRASRWFEAPAKPTRISSPDPLLAVLARWAGCAFAAETSALQGLTDLRQDPARALKLLEAHSAPVELRFACGARFLTGRLDRWKFWKKPWSEAQDQVRP